MSQSAPENLKAVCDALRPVPGSSANDLSGLRSLCFALRSAAAELRESSPLWCEEREVLMSRLQAPPAGQPFASGAAAAGALEEAPPEVGPHPFKEELAVRWEQANAHQSSTGLVAEFALRRVLAIEPSHGGAHDRLATLYRARHEAARAEGGTDADRWETLLSWHDRGTHADWLAATATLDLQTVPEGAAVTATGAHGETIELGTTPLHAAELPEGAWRLRLSGAGGGSAFVPVMLPRCTHQEAGDVPVRLLSPGVLDPEWVHIPSGHFIYGGDPQGDYSLPRQRLFLPGFAIARIPVTFEEYIQFLNILYTQAPEEAVQRVPRAVAGNGHRALVPTRPDPPVFRLPPGDFGRCPVIGVSHDDAMRYVEWVSARDGVEYFLPTERQWEKAARGADGRLYPWGDTFDNARCNMRYTTNQPRLRPAGTHPGDVSPYGMLDPAGNIMEWCQPGPDPVPAGGIPIRGGSWHSSPQACRTADRFGCGPHYVTESLGFRLARPLPVGGGGQGA